METNIKRAQLNNTGTNILGQLWFKYFPYWPLFVVFFAIAVFGAWWNLRKQVPLYESSAAILIKDEKKGEDESKMIEALNQLSSKKIIENEIEVLKSRALMSVVVNKLNLYAVVSENGKIHPFSAYLTSPIVIEAATPDSIVESPKIPFRLDTAGKTISFLKEKYPLNEWVRTSMGRLKFNYRTPVNPSSNPMYFQLVSPVRVALSTIGNLDVSTASKLSSVVKIKIRDEVPQRGEDILNGLIDAYNIAAVNDKNTLAMNTLAFVNERLNSVGHDLDSIEQKLKNYKANRGAIDIGSQGNLFLQNVSTIDNRMSDVNMQLAVLDKVENYVTSKDNGGGTGIVPSSVGVTDPMLSQLLEKKYDYELQYEKLKKTTATNNPILLSLNDQIEKIKPSILENIRSQRSGLEASRNNLSSINNKYSSLLSSIPQKEKDLVEISREQSVKSNIYNFLLQKKEETAMSLSSSITNSRIVDRAQSTLAPVAPNKKKTYMIAVGLAFAFGIGLVTLNELLKRTILFRHEIESFTSIPVIGEIAYEKSKESIVIGNGKRTFIAEQFRNLRTSLHYVGLNANRKKLLITSTVSGEGKSFIVANLGVSLAIAGKKVVVLEFDLSDPTLCSKLNFTATKGITDYLNGTAEPEEIVRRTSVHENLFIMPAGELPENPSEMIMSEKVPELLEYLSGIFDYILIDSAPVGLLSDGYILSGYCDATLYVVRHRHTRKISIQRLDENNKINELKNVAIVFNGVRARGFNKNGYGYGYGYGYIYNEGKKKKKRLPA